MSRDLGATRAAILAAAEEAFAERGYEGASMQQIATSAGVSRGMPGYAFGSKAELYEAVLDQAFASPRAIAAELAAGVQRGDDQALAAAVARYLEFLATHPRYVRLLQRASLEGARLGHGAAHQEALGDALGATGASLQAGPAGADARQLLVSVLALCFFPFAHRDTLLGPLGLDVGDPGFVAARTAHIVELLGRRFPRS